MNIRIRALLLAFALSTLSSAAGAADDWPFPLEVLVPFEPTPFQSGGRTHLAYELHLRNFGSDAITLQRVEVLDANGDKLLASFAGPELVSMLEPVSYEPNGEAADATHLPAGASTVVFMWISLEHSQKAPTQFRNRVITTAAHINGPVLNVRHDLRVFRSPLTGAHWKANDGPSNDAENHHRRGILVVEGRAVLDRRFATDWVQVENGATFTGDKRDKLAYHAYGEPLRAVADARVVFVMDGLPDNVPGHNEEFSPAVPITMATVAGNRVVLDLGGGLFAHYFHMQAGSLKVKAGDRVRRGQLLGQIGASGDAREPHLHFEVTTSPKLAAGEGVPYLIDGYRAGTPRTRELPLKDEIVDFD